MRSLVVHISMTGRVAFAADREIDGYLDRWDAREGLIVGKQTSDR